jgi:hypothetical protein
MSLQAMAHGNHRCDDDKKTIADCIDHHRSCIAGGIGGGFVSDYIEIIYPQEMKARLMCNGEIVEEYKIEQCDKCSQLRRLDHFGYQKGYDKQDNIIWFCGDCR